MRERKAHIWQVLNRSSFSCYVIDFKTHKQPSHSSSSAAHLHFKPARTASPATDSHSASLPPAGFIWGERVSRNGVGRVDGEPAPDQEQGNYTVLVLSYAAWMARWEKPLKHGEGCHMPAKCASMHFTALNTAANSLTVGKQTEKKKSLQPLLNDSRIKQY